MHRTTLMNRTIVGLRSSFERPTGSARIRRWCGRFVAATSGALAASAFTCLGGCSSDGNREFAAAPTVLTIERASYDRAFDEAVELVAEAGMPADLRDRDGGVIESRPNVSGSVLEPWDWAAGSPVAAVEDTVNHQRRRVRFEFLPAGFRPATPIADAPLEGERTPGSVAGDAAGAVDLAHYEGPVELRVWVYVERSYTPYLQRSTWTFRGRSFARNPDEVRRGEDGAVLDPSKWTPVRRDADMEREILDALRGKLATPAPSTPAA